MHRSAFLKRKRSKKKKALAQKRKSAKALALKTLTFMFMFLKEFKPGWQAVFEPKLNNLINRFPGTALESTERYMGMLRVKLKALDNDTQYIVDCVTYKMERESVHVCEVCGLQGTRRKDPLLGEILCLCWLCYIDLSNEKGNHYYTTV